MRLLSCFQKLFVALILIGGVALPATALAVGASPALVVVEDLTNASTIEKKVEITRSDSNGDLSFEVVSSGDGARYIQMASTTLTIPNGKTSAPLLFTIAPKTAPNGLVEGVIRLTSLSAKDGSGGNGSNAQLSIKQSVTIKIRMTITDRQISSFGILRVSSASVEADQAPQFSFLVKNTGNIDAKPDRIVVELYDARDNSFIATSTPSTAETEFVVPGAEDTLSVSLAEPLPVGRYFANLAFYAGDTLVHAVKNQGFEVVPIGSLAQNLSLESIGVSPEVASPGQTVKIDLLFKNTGTAIVKATGYVDVKKGEESVDVLKGDEKTIALNSNGKTTILWKPTEEGEYTLDVYASYAAGETVHHAKRVIISKKKAIDQTESAAVASLATSTVTTSTDGIIGWIVLIGAGLVFLALFIVIIIIVKRHHHQPPQTPPQPPQTPPQPPQTPPQPPQGVV